MLGTILWIIIGGIIIGLIAKWIVPSNRDNIPFWLTIVCGILGILVGNWIYAALFHNGQFVETSGFDWWRHIWQVAVAIVFVIIASAITAGSRGRRV
ncbi:GlsB/YeaQ/YmgE family stress response membrane protein [Gryllotalpicola ginsengisoli]|uniref:GlsB/YeaQ/YmgE family stress response membrane protein n=1 Tax=Gryllotalpicola ginsengisoli TaxID=444608 RepID=UPI0003B7926E|nr:GlsB/YeaQ/YmgE family stress response membrane protein [Gryllotalpicola ginsengisoli]